MLLATLGESDQGKLLYQAAPDAPPKDIHAKPVHEGCGEEAHYQTQADRPGQDHLREGGWQEKQQNHVHGTDSITRHGFPRSIIKFFSRT